MKKWLAGLALGLCSVAMVAVTTDAEAKRMGGGRSFGRQSSNVTQKRDAAPQQQPQQGQQAGQPNAAQSSAAAAPQAAGAAARPGNRWLGPIAGIAAGLGIAALLSHMGLSGAFAEFLGSFLLIALLVAAGVFAWRMLRRRAAPGMQRRMEPAYAGTGAGPRPGTDPSPAPVFGQSPAPARTAEPAGLQELPGGAGVAPAASWSVPSDFDAEGFLTNAKRYFVELQTAWDRADLETAQQLTTDEMFEDIKRQVQERGGAVNQTEVVILNAQLLGIEQFEGEYMASVRFSGMVREESKADAVSFAEVWNLVKPAAGQGGWLLAGVQQVQ
jgi:predicted lipid-binding transport protein (Tim44 family)